MAEWKVALVAAAVGAAVGISVAALAGLSLQAELARRSGPCPDCADRHSADVPRETQDEDV